MIIWGKIAGAIFGYLLGGWTGLIVGVFIGNYLDNGIRRAIEHDQFGFNHRPGNQEQIQTTFFTAVFSVMGHMAKADGRVSESEITLARNIMRQMQLDSTQEKTAMELFSKGKAPDFPLEDVIDNFHRECHHNRNLERMFMPMDICMRQNVIFVIAFAPGWELPSLNLNASKRWCMHNSLFMVVQDRTVDHKSHHKVFLKKLMKRWA